MITFLSLVTSVKDYVEIVHKLIESDSSFNINNYEEFGPIITYLVITLQEFFRNLITLKWLNNLWDLPIIIPDISSAMVSEISVLDNYFHNAFNFLDKPLSYGETNLFFYNLEKFSIGLINSLFLFIPTGTSHLIIIRRFVMQGLEAGYLAGLGSIAGNILWITSVIFGFRFFVIPWLSLDIFRYILGFVLLVKYMWDSYNEKKMAITTESAKQKIFLLNFLLALTEQTSIYPFLTNLSIGSDSTILESFPAQDLTSFITTHSSYIFGLTLGCLSLLHLTCWFWENPAFKIYMWLISSFKVSTSFYYKVLNFTFLYLTMICAISSIPYYGLDYTLTNPLGLVQDDRILYQSETLAKAPQLSFLGTKASDRNTRRNRGRHGRRERWKRRIRKYRTFDASLYDQGIYDLFTIEDLNYGFDRFWLRRKMRNHRVRFRFFPGPWMRSFKKQLAKPRLESYAGPRQEFFRILFEQVYHPSFHVYSKTSDSKITKINKLTNITPKPKEFWFTLKNLDNAPSGAAGNSKIKKNLKVENSTLRKFVRKMDTRLKISQIQSNLGDSNLNSLLKIQKTKNLKTGDSTNSIYSKRWKQIFSKISHSQKRYGDKTLLTNNKALLNNLYETSLPSNGLPSNIVSGYLRSIKKQNSQILLNFDGGNDATATQQILKYRSLYLNSKNSIKNSFALQSKAREPLIIPNSKGIAEAQKGYNNLQKGLAATGFRQNFSDFGVTLFHPLKIYQKQQQAFEKKLHYYTPTVFRKFSIENNAPYFRVMMKRYFYYYKPTLRWERTMKVASMRKARRKTASNPRRIQFPDNGADLRLNQLSNVASTQDSQSSNSFGKIFNNFSRKTIPTHNYTIVGKRASRYRYQIYKDVLQHWYYTPFNRLLLKLDIDLFINRQPNSHFLTKDEENLLHIRRFLLSEHYNTLRWYTQMEHYRSMKTKIGGTKSFASGIYNQQFSGTFKKIRHLFAITPSQGDQSVLKFDQPLYNEYFNNTSNNIQNNLIIHEELLTNSLNSNAETIPNTSVETKTNNLSNTGNKIAGMQNVTPKPEKFTLLSNLDYDGGAAGTSKDLLNQSTQIIRTYLNDTNPIKQEYIKKLLEEKNYVELTNFLYKGRKIRGLKPVVNSSDFINQEKDYLLTNTELKSLKELEKLKFDNFVKSSFPTDLWLNLLKKWKRKINDQEFLKNYLQRRVEKREKRKFKKEKAIKTKLERLANIGFLNNIEQNQSLKNFSGTSALTNSTTNANLLNHENQIPTGVQNSLNEGLLTLNSNKGRGFAPQSRVTLDHLKYQFLIKQEKQLRISLNKLSEILNKSSKIDKTTKNQFRIKLKNAKQAFAITPIRLKNLYINYQSKTIKIFKNRVFKIFTKSKTRKDNFKAWQEKERTLNKQKRMRKEFKPLSKNSFKYDSKNYSKYLDQKTDIPLTKTNPEGVWRNIKEANIRTNISTNIFETSQIKKLSDSIFSKNTNIDNSIEVTPKREELVFNPARKKIDSTVVDPNQIMGGRNEIVENLNSNVSRFATATQILKNAYSKYFRKNFKRKKSPQRRVRVRKNRAVIKKRTLNDSLKREFKNLRRYNQTLQMSKADLALFSLTGTPSDLSSKNQLFQPSPLQRRAKQKKQRFWKQKRMKFSQKLRKYKKRRRSVLGKIRILNKQLKRIKATNDLKVWWWKSFLPNLRATTDSLWQYEKDRQIQQKLLELSLPEILERDKLNIDNYLSNVTSKPEGLSHLNTLQIGDFDYKPLALPQALRLQNTTVTQNTEGLSSILSQNNIESSGFAKQSHVSSNNNAAPILNNFEKSTEQLRQIDGGLSPIFDPFSRIAETYLLSNKKNNVLNASDFAADVLDVTSKPKKLWPPKLQNSSILTSPIPFYAGWDESLRKFVVTNRLLSRRESGYEMNLNQLSRERLSDANLIELNKTNSEFVGLNEFARGKAASDSSNFEFTAAPLKGMNTATTLYWQIPFTTYDPDQFFALGMDGFAPLGWRRFQFRHSILKSWLYEKSTPFSISNQKSLTGSKTNNTLTHSQGPLGFVGNNGTSQSNVTYIVKNKIFARGEDAGNIQTKTKELWGNNIKSSNLVSKLKEKNSPFNGFKLHGGFAASNKNLNLADKNTRNIYRRLKKRYRRVKKHPRSPVWFPSGPLLNQVLPVHYIYIFYKRSRLPRDRYIKRRLVKSKTQTNLNEKNIPSNLVANSPENSNPISDFTLRKRVKTKRKYHIKQDLTKQSNYARGFGAGLIPRRVKFVGENSDILRWRPLSRQKLTKPLAELIKEKRLLRTKQRKKELQELNSKQPANIRVKQLRRRVQRQIIRSVLRYKPRAGGFVWPGDYLRLELVKAPKLNSNINGSIAVQPENMAKNNDAQALRTGSIKVKRKKKRNIQEWQIQPKKYLLQKHNYNVIKKKLFKAQRLNKIQERTKELTLIL